MIQLTGKEHILKQFDHEMSHLHELVLQMGKLAHKQLSDANKTLQQKNLPLALEVIKNDTILNELDIQVDTKITSIIARRQPVARDLRKLIAVGKIVTDLERAGDEARKIAGLTIRFFKQAVSPPSNKILKDISNLSGFVIKMLDNSMQSFDDLDLYLATKVMNNSLILDNLLQETLRNLSMIVIMEHLYQIDQIVDIVLGIRALERFGGHAKNIAGHIFFITSGESVRHTRYSDIEKILSKWLSTFN